MSNTNVELQAVSRMEFYLKYLVVGGDINKLPPPVSRKETIIHSMILNGLGLPQRVPGYYKCVLNSEAGGQNFVTGFLDLGEGHSVTTAKVKVRFRINPTGGTEVPTKIDIRLSASKSPARNLIDTNEYFVTGEAKENLQAQEYTVEQSFTTSDDKALTSFRYFKAFLALHKLAGGDTTYTKTHSIDVYEFSIEANGVIYDITDTIRDLNGQSGSKIEYIEGSVYPMDSIKLKNLPYFNKTLVLLSDSIGFGYDSSNNGKQLKDPYATQLSTLCGFSNVRNNGISSSTVATKTSDSAWAGVRNPMVTRAQSLDKNADVVLFCGGVNDHTQHVPIGELVGTNVDTNTYFGAVNQTLKTLIARYPNKLIIAMSPMDYVDTRYVDGKNNNGNTVEDFREAMRLACELNGVHYLDLHEKVGFNANNPEDVKLYFTETDKLHPNQLGQNKMALVISKEINKLA